MSTTADLSDVLDQISARLAALERKVDALAPPRAQAPAEGLSRLTDRLDRIEAAIDAVGTFAERLPVIADAAGTGATWAWHQAEQRGVDPIVAGQAAAELGLDLARPENLAFAKRLLANRRSAEIALGALDAIDPADLEVVATRGAALTRTLAAVLKSPELARILEAGADPTALKTAESATTALVEARKDPIEPVGPFGALMKLGDPDVKRAVGFSLALAKRFGRLLAG
ncbi:MAG: DUF1641 domain-containing protein [Myxococcota bacterium]